MTKTNREADMAVQPKANSKSHIPQNSILFEKIVPVLLILLGIITAGLMLFAAGVLLGIVRF
jgi:hypothetical protein